ncbi:hypothetical protein [Caldimonas sp.]|uniref:hypothetical protein n=1 Tax=Caldimonas sp. TaxID=2838790 RepID=UPI00391CB2A1
MTNSQSDMLQAVLGELVAFAGQPDDPLADADRWQWSMRHRGVPYRPDHWHGARLTPAQRMTCSRAVRGMATAGLVERVTEPRRNRVTHLRPTAAGLARALAGNDANQTAVTLALRKTDWGAALADEIERAVKVAA